MGAGRAAGHPLGTSDPCAGWGCAAVLTPGAQLYSGLVQSAVMLTSPSPPPPSGAHAGGRGSSGPRRRRWRRRHGHLQPAQARPGARRAAGALHEGQHGWGLQGGLGVAGGAAALTHATTQLGALRQAWGNPRRRHLLPLVYPQCIGATTLDEHRKHIERDAALER